MTLERNKLIKVLVVGGIGAVALFAVRQSLGLELDPEAVRGAAASMGVWAPLAFILIMAFRVPLGLPSQVVLVGGGLIFGTVAGTAYGAVGITISAAALFIGARWVGRDVIEARLPDRLRSLMELAGSRVGAAFMAVGTGYPFGPITMYHAVAGLTGMALPIFLVAVLLGAAVRAATYTYFGSSLVSGDSHRLLQALGLMALALLVPLALPRTRSWLLQVLGRRDPDAGEPTRRVTRDGSPDDAGPMLGPRS